MWIDKVKAGWISQNGRGDLHSMIMRKIERNRVEKSWSSTCVVSKICCNFALILEVNTQLYCCLTFSQRRIGYWQATTKEASQTLRSCLDLNVHVHSNASKLPPSSSSLVNPSNSLLKLMIWIQDSYAILVLIEGCSSAVPSAIIDSYYSLFLYYVYCGMEGAAAALAQQAEEWLATKERTKRFSLQYSSMATTTGECAAWAAAMCLVRTQRPRGWGAGSRSHPTR